MAYDYSDLVEQSQQWAQHATQAGWISNEAAQVVLELNPRSSDALFQSGTTRPLIVAFMGGTGVGKSSLLNRLAGKPIAKAGIERPTSREVTLFHHHSVAIQQLPEQFPLTQIKIAQHDDDDKKNIIWIDMPDFDSTEHSNKQLVLQWLPHIDILIYVVSPERYRDEKAWRLLLAEGTKHAWLFVLNQWDRGRVEQYEDFKQQLQLAGFFEPIIMKTVCADEPQVDEFATLESTILGLATAHIIEQLEQRCLQAHKAVLQQALQHIQTQIAPAAAGQHLPTLWHTQWQHTTAQLQQGFAWSLQNAATYYANHAADLISNSNMPRVALWDEWAQARFDDALDDFMLNAHQQGIPAQALRPQLALLRDKAPKLIQTHTELAARQALANPGNALQRGMLKTMRLCEIILPLAAMTWVGYQVFIGFYTSNLTSSHYLGVDFAIHGGLLIALTWLTPFFILKKLQPSLQKSALRGLTKGLNIAFDVINTDVLASVAVVNQQQIECVSQLTELIAHCESDVNHTASVDSHAILSRLLMN